MILTAAGCSSRHPPNKLLLRLGDRSVISQTVAAFVGLVDPLILVTGHNADRLTTIVTRDHPGAVTCVYNRNYNQGLSTSVQEGLSALMISGAGVGFCNGDRPFIRRETVAQWIDAIQKAIDKIVFPVFQDQPGQPIYFPSDLVDEFSHISGDEGGRSIRDAHRERWHPISVKDRGVIGDMDRYLEAQE